MTKAISAVIATVMLLMTTVSLVGVFYVFSSTLATQTTSSGDQQASQLTAQLSMCMQVDNIAGNQITLRNCGKGVIENKSLVVMMDDIVLGANTNTIQEGNSSVVNISGLWQIPFGKHSLKITNGAAVAQSLVEIIPNPDGLAGSWNFDEGSGGRAYDGSGNGNVGTLANMNITGNGTSGWTDGKFREGLQFDGVNDYVDAGNGASLNITDAITVSVWMKTTVNTLSRTLLMKWPGYVIDVRSWAPNGEFDISVDGVEAIQAFGGNNIDGNWHNLVGTYDSNTRRLTTYRDSVLSLSTVLNGRNSYTIDTTTNVLKFGDYFGNRHYNGTIDEVRIWSRALAPDETVAMKRII
ncbi:MAG: LamG domain-containing protein [Candidatus Aenigmatarchaeota archaeon]